MNFRRFLSLLLLLFVFCFVLFSASFTAHAASVDNITSDEHLDPISSNEVSVMSVEDVASTADKINYMVFYSNNSTGSFGGTLLTNIVNAGSWGIQYSVDLKPYRFSDYYITERFTYSKGTNNLIASKGSSVKFELSGIYNRLSATDSNNNYYESYSHPDNIKSMVVELFDKNGNRFYYNELPKTSLYHTTVTGSTLDCITFDLDDLTSDLYMITVDVRFLCNPMFIDIPSSVWNSPQEYKLGFGLGDKTMLQVFVDDGQKGLLKGILSGITELPGKLWNLIENGLKGLFVPTESQMTEVKGQWDSLLSDRFGGLYQTVQLIDDYAATFKVPTSSQSTIDFPEFRLNVGSDSEFVLQAHDVHIIPDRFSFLVDVLKTIISIIATCFFINGLRNKFERLVGGHE